MDKKIVIDCPLCSAHELNVEIGEDSNGLQQCIGCGYSTNDDFVVDDTTSKFDNVQFKELDEFMQNHSMVKNNHIWIPSVMQLPIGIYYPSEKDKKIIWFFAPLVDIPESDQKNYPSPEGGYYSKRYDMEKQLEFSNFGEGLVEINMVMNAIKQAKKGKDETDSSKS